MQKMNVVMRPAANPDISAIHYFWQQIMEMPLLSGDDTDGLSKQIATKHDLFLLAFIKDQLVGTAMGTFCGRRGWLYRLAVHPDYQLQGIGGQLIAAVEARLIELGCQQINIFVLQTESELQNYYARRGYEKRQDVITLSKILSDNVPRYF